MLLLTLLLGHQIQIIQPIDLLLIVHYLERKKQNLRLTGNLQNPWEKQRFPHCALALGSVVGRRPAAGHRGRRLRTNENPWGSLHFSQPEPDGIGIDRCRPPKVIGNLTFGGEPWESLKKHGFPHSAVAASFTSSGRNPAEHLGITPRNRWKTL